VFPQIVLFIMEYRNRFDYAFQPQQTYFGRFPYFWNSPEIVARRNRDNCERYRCGKLFFRNHLGSCNTRQSQCFKCGKQGQRLRQFYRNANLQPLSQRRNKTTEQRKKSKSAAKQRRNSKSMKTYKVKREIMCILPFQTISESELHEITNKSCKTKHIKKLEN